MVAMENRYVEHKTLILLIQSNLNAADLVLPFGKVDVVDRQLLLFGFEVFEDLLKRCLEVYILVTTRHQTDVDVRTR